MEKRKPETKITPKLAIYRDIDDANSSTIYTCSSTGSIPSEEYVRKYGCVTVLDKVQSDLGILDDLRECFPDIAENIMATSMSVAIDPTPFDDVHFTVDENGLKDRMRLHGNLSPTVLSDMTKDLGQRLSAMDLFFTRRVARMDGEGSYSIDITSNSTHSDMGGYVEWGYNLDGDELKQTEFMLVTDSKGIPLMKDYDSIRRHEGRTYRVVEF